MPRRSSARALLLIDYFNPQGFAPVPGAEALRAAGRTAALKARLHRAGVPAIYANDNFGQWAAEFSVLVAKCAARRGVAGEIARLLAPAPGDWSVLKPRHSAFYGTPLEFMLEAIGAQTLILTGVAAESCITITAHEAHVRRYRVWVPRDCVAGAHPSGLDGTLHRLRQVAKASIRASAPP